MAKFIRNFQTENEFKSAYNGSEYIEPWVSLTKRGHGDVVKMTVNIPDDEGQVDVVYIGTAVVLEESETCYYGGPFTEQQVTATGTFDYKGMILDTAATTSSETIVFVKLPEVETEDTVLWEGLIMSGGTPVDEGGMAFYTDKEATVSVGDTVNVISTEKGITIQTNTRKISTGDKVEAQDSEHNIFSGTVINIIEEVPGEVVNKIGYNKEPFTITVKTVHGNYPNQVIDDTTTYNTMDIDFNTLMGPVFAAHGSNKYLGVSCYNGTEILLDGVNRFAGGHTYNQDLTPDKITLTGGRYPALYDFTYERFLENGNNGYMIISWVEVDG